MAPSSGPLGAFSHSAFWSSFENATGVAGLIEVARALADEPLDRTVIFVAYANEEPPFFRTDSMGSRVHARSLAEDPERTVTAMVCLEQLGCFSRTEGRKRRWWVGLFGLNDRTDYIAFLCNPGSRRVAKEAARVFVETAPIPVKVMPVPRSATGCSVNEAPSLRYFDASSPTAGSRRPGLREQPPNRPGRWST